MPLENDEAAGAQVTGSTFSGYPQVVGGVYSSGSYVTSLYTDVSGALYVTTSGSLGVAVQGPVAAAIQNWPSTIGVSGTVALSNNPPVNVYTSGPQAVSGGVNLTNWPATLGVSASANIPVVVQNQPLTTNVSGTVGAVIENWPATIGVSGTIATTPGPTNVYTSGPQGVSGTVAAIIQNQPLTTNISGSVTVGGWANNVTGTISGTVGAIVENWPLTLNVSGTVALSNNPPVNVYTSGLQGVSGTLGTVIQNQPATVGVSGSVNVYTSGLQGVSGTVGAVVENWPATINVSGSVATTPGPTNVYTSGLQGVSGAVSLLNWPAVVGVTGSVGATIQNWPALVGVSGTVSVFIQNEGHNMGVSGSQLTGSTFNGSPVVMGGVFSGSQYAVTAVRTDVSGAVYVTTTGSLPVTFAGPQPATIQNWPAVIGVTGSVGAIVDNWPALIGISGTVGAIVQNWPATINVSGTVALSNNPPVNVYTSGLQGISGAVSLLNWPATIGVSASANIPVVVQNQPLTTAITGAVSLTNWPATLGVSASVNLPVVVQNQPLTTNVSGGIVVQNWPLTHATTGSQLTGSTYAGFPVVVGGVYQASYGSAVQALEVDANGALYVTTNPTGTAIAVQGIVASGSTIQGNPIPMAGVDSTGKVRAIDVDSSGRIITAPAGTNVTNGSAKGYVATSAKTNVTLSATAYTEQSTNFTGSIVSTSTADASAGTGARTATITYVDSTGATLGTETVTLNGTTAVNLVNGFKCFIEKIVINTVGSGGSNAGTIELFTGTGGAGTQVASIAIGDNQTNLGHHYVVTGKTCNIGAMTGLTNSSNESLFWIQAVSIPVANEANLQVTDWITGAQTFQPLRTFSVPIQVSGPARIQMWVQPGSTSTLISYGAFDFYDQ